MKNNICINITLIHLLPIPNCGGPPINPPLYGCGGPKKWAIANERNYLIIYVPWKPPLKGGCPWYPYCGPRPPILIGVIWLKNYYNKGREEMKRDRERQREGERRGEGHTLIVALIVQK
jgi:hypothetical protein